MSPLEVSLAFALLVGLPAVAWLVKASTERAWRCRADGLTRIESGGELFHVVRDGDTRKARQVLESSKVAEHEAQL